MTTLRDMCLQITDGKHGDCQNEDGSGYYFISCKDVKDGWIDYSGARQIKKEDYLDTHRRTRLEPNDILITNSGTIGRMALVQVAPETGRTTFQKSVAILKPKQHTVVPRWLYYNLMARKEALIAWAGGTAQKNLLLRDLRAFEITTPPYPTQRKIAAILSAYDDLIENNLRRIKILEEMAQALYREWFVKFRFPGHEKVRMVESPLGMIPEGWEVRTLGDIAKIKGRIGWRGYKKSDLRRSGPLVIGAGQITKEHCLDLSKPNYISREKYEESPEIMLHKDDIVISTTGVIGRVAILNTEIGDATLNPNSVVLKNITLDRYYLYHYLISDYAQNFMRSRNTAVAQPAINQGELKKMQVCQPSKGVQEQFREFVATSNYNSANLILKNNNLRRTRDLLLPKLISGELDVSDLDITVPEEAA